MIEQLTLSQKKILQAHNKKPLSRRDFMALGMLGSLGLLTLPSLIPSTGFAQQARPSLPFIVFDLVGGAALPGNFLVGGRGGSEDLLGSYSTLGFDPRQATMDRRFGLPSPQNISQIFEGMIQTMSPDAQKNLRLTSIAHQAVDDSSNNTTSSLGLVAQYWNLKGQLSQKGFGTVGTNSGGRTQLSYDTAMVRPEVLTDVTQLNLLSGLGYLANAGLSAKELNVFAKHQSQLIKEQIKDMSSQADLSFQNKLYEQVESYLKILQDRPPLDPRLETVAREVFSLQQNSSPTSREVIAAGIANTSLSDGCGPSCVALDGYDYHDGTQNTGDQADLRAGRIIGASVELAHRKNRSFFFQILTDGGCSTRGDRRWEADSGDRTLSIMGYFNPNGVEQIKTQLGNYTQGEIANIDTYVGRRTSNVSNIVALNYLACLGDTGAIHDLITTDDLPVSMIDEHLAFS